MDERSATCKALVLAGGGARGSYQVGVWRAMMELDWHPQIITGTSVGSLNGAMFVLDQYETARDMWPVSYTHLGCQWENGLFQEKIVTFFANWRHFEGERTPSVKTLSLIHISRCCPSAPRVWTL